MADRIPDTVLDNYYLDVWRSEYGWDYFDQPDDYERKDEKDDDSV